jgi:hypothetical protein
MANASTLIRSVLPGLALFKESLSCRQGQLLPAFLGFILAIYGVVLLSPPEEGRMEPVHE